MRRGCALLPVLWTGLLAGCITGEPVRTTAWLDGLRSGYQPAAVGDVVQMDVALVEQPLGDRYLIRDLWAFTDEQVIAVELKALLEDNGFRIGQVGGIPPAGLQALLTSDRSCINPHRIQLHASKPRTLVLGPAMPECSFELHQDGRTVPVTWKQAECTLRVVPTLTKDGRTCLHFTPQIQHGDPLLMPRPAADLSGWVRQEERPTEDYPSLSWDVCLAPNEYVIVGSRFDRTGTLGHECFLRRDEATPVQRLLVIRTSRPATGVQTTPVSPEGESDDPLTGSPPLAYQASLTGAGGSGQ